MQNRLSGRGARDLEITRSLGRPRQSRRQSTKPATRYEHHVSARPAPDTAKGPLTLCLFVVGGPNKTQPNPAADSVVKLEDQFARELRGSMAGFAGRLENRWQEPGDRW